MKLDEKQIEKLIAIAKEAGEIIQKHYQDYKTDFVLKDDKSEVTQADLEANDYILSELNKFFPDIAVVSEEKSEEDNLVAAANPIYFMIDPLDGTSGFIKRIDEFTVNIALIENAKPILGIIYLPAKDILYYTDADYTAWRVKGGNKKTIRASATKQENMAIICTKREPEKSDVIAMLKEKNINSDNLLSVASSYKFCLIADGSADLYPRKVSIRAWDIAAGEAIVKAAGGRMHDYQNQELVYKFTENFEVPAFIVTGDFSI